MAEKLSLGGREYVEATIGPVRHDLFIMQHTRHAGLSPIADGETPEAYMQRLLASVLSSGRALLLLGGLLWPAGTKPEQWDEELAYATAGHLGGIIDPEEKAKLYAELSRALLSFFENGLGSWVASAASSVAEAEPPPSNSTDATVSGPPSSGPSRATTTIRRGGFWRGLWTRLSSPTGGTYGARRRTRTATSR